MFFRCNAPFQANLNGNMFSGVYIRVLYCRLNLTFEWKQMNFSVAKTKRYKALQSFIYGFHTIWSARFIYCSKQNWNRERERVRGKVCLETEIANVTWRQNQKFFFLKRVFFLVSIEKLGTWAFKNMEKLASFFAARWTTSPTATTLCWITISYYTVQNTKLKLTSLQTASDRHTGQRNTFTFSWSAWNVLHIILFAAPCVRN